VSIQVRRTLIPLARGAAVLAALTIVAFRLHLNSAAAACLYLIAVVANCLDCGPWTAAAVSLAAVGCLDFFFIEPLFHFTVADRVDVAALAAFLTSSLLVSRLAGRARYEAKAARRERCQFERLYELSQRIISLNPLRLDQSILLEAICDVFGLEGAVLFDASTAAIHSVGAAPEELTAGTRQTYIVGRYPGQPIPGMAFHPLHAAGKSFGAIGFRGLEDENRLAGPIAALAVAGLERARTVRAASQAAAVAQSETFRAAVLDALAHEFKTPLATILTAAGGLREAAPLPPEQAELAEIVEAEAGRLSDLSSHLLQMARLDREQLKPRLEPNNVGELVQAVVERHAQQIPNRSLLLDRPEDMRNAIVDDQLYSLALSQLLDNACRYSPPDSNVEVKLETRNGFAEVTVRNCGRPIPSEERERIFERFYRGADTRDSTSGTGLGLYVARKIALAHGGRLELDPVKLHDRRIAFRFAVPLAANGS
jgi:two-component system, OmpR family, sensor histidine kinase KdpD